MPQGFASHTLLPHGRDPTSIAFFIAPGGPRLYSGVTKSTPSQAPTALRNCVQACGGFAVSRSWLYNGKAPISTRCHSIPGVCIDCRAPATRPDTAFFDKPPAISAILRFATSLLPGLDDAARDARAATAVGLRLIGIVVAALVDHERLALQLAQCEMRGGHGPRRRAIRRDLERRKVAEVSRALRTGMLVRLLRIVVLARHFARRHLLVLFL